jgi:Zn-dependent protease
MTRLLMTAGVFVLMIAVFLFSIVFHEVSHGYVAYRLGDPTAKESGRLTLNPLKHLDPMGVIFFVAMIALFHIGIGWAKPVPIDPRYFRHPRRDILLVSIAGPGANFVLAVLGFALFYVWRIARAPLPGVADILELLVVINMLLMVFNLIPIPPLDGSRVLTMISPRTFGRFVASLEPYGFLIIVLLFFVKMPQTGESVLTYVLGSFVNHIDALLRGIAPL